MAKGSVITVGMFDGVHLGHRSIIEMTALTARKLGLKSIAVTFDRHPLSVVAPEKVPLLLSDIKERIELIKALGIDEVVVMNFDEQRRKLTAEEFISQFLVKDLRMQVLVIGHDHGFGSDRLRGLENFKAIGDRIGFRVIEAPYWGEERVCSSAIREFLEKGNIVKANSLLGRPFSISGKVEHGRQIGRTLNFPTANIPIPKSLILPTNGVYATFVTDLQTGKKYKATVNIGTAPTVSDKGQRRIEAYLIDFDGNLYDQFLTIEFIERLRDEKKFASLEDLREQLKKDISRTRELCL